VSIIDYDHTKPLLDQGSRKGERGELLNVLENYQREVTRVVDTGKGGRGQKRRDRDMPAVPPRRSVRIAKQGDVNP
jgi:hypothetical protein